MSSSSTQRALDARALVDGARPRPRRRRPRVRTAPRSDPHGALAGRHVRRSRAGPRPDRRRLGDGRTRRSSHVVSRVLPGVEVLFIDTGYHFEETLRDRPPRRSPVQHLAEGDRRAAASSEPRYLTDPDGCCNERKVVPLEEALRGRVAWISGVRRSDSASRAATPFVHRDRRGLLKLNPIAHWTDADARRVRAPTTTSSMNPLLAQGYPSIGCWPCTRRTVAGRGHPRRALGRTGQDGVRPPPLTPLARRRVTPTPRSRPASHPEEARRARSRTCRPRRRRPRRPRAADAQGRTADRRRGRGAVRPVGVGGDPRARRRRRPS